MEGNYCKECLVTGRLEHDIVSSLPHELVIHVVEYIDVADIVRCQMVWCYLNNPKVTSVTVPS